MKKILEKSGNFVRGKKLEPCSEHAWNCPLVATSIRLKMFFSEKHSSDRHYRQEGSVVSTITKCRFFCELKFSLEADPVYLDSIML